MPTLNSQHWYFLHPKKRKGKIVSLPHPSREKNEKLENEILINFLKGWEGKYYKIVKYPILLKIRAGLASPVHNFCLHLYLLKIRWLAVVILTFLHHYPSLLTSMKLVVIPPI